MVGCQDYGPFLGTLNIRGRIIIGTQKKDHNFDNHPYIVYILYSRILLSGNIRDWRISLRLPKCATINEMSLQYPSKPLNPKPYKPHTPPKNPPKVKAPEVPEPPEVLNCGTL